MRKFKAHNLMEASVKKEASSYNINRVAVALSGGADSIAVAYLLKEAKLDLIALHCNFHLRGEESNRDMKFVEEFCERFQIPLMIKEFDVPQYQDRHKGCSLEMACRNLRYEWFEEQLKETGFQRIATGHNADDNIETFFLNILRGSGTRGLKGMVKDTGVIWRPVLDYHRSEILEYLKESNLDYITDSTNLQNDFRRNYLRNEIIPLLRKEWKGFNAALQKTICNLVSENKVVESSLDSILSQTSECLPVEEILKYPAPLLLVKRFIEPLGPFSTTPEEVIEAIKANKPHIRKWRLKKGFLILRNKKLFIEMGHGKSCS